MSSKLIHNLSLGKWLKLSMQSSPSPENPNCMLNAIVYPQNKNLKSSGIGRNFDNGHDGRHARGVENQIGNIITLSPLTGWIQALKWGQPEDSVGGGGNRIIDVKLDKHPYFAIYKDLLTVKVVKQQYLR